MIYVYANQLVPDSFQKQCGNNGTIDSARKCQQYLSVTDLTSYQFDLVIDEVRHVPVRFGFTSVEYECFYRFFDCLHVTGEFI